MDFVVVVSERRWALVGRRGGGRGVLGGAGLGTRFASSPQSDGGQNADDVHVIVHGPGEDAEQAD